MILPNGAGMMNKNKLFYNRSQEFSVTFNDTSVTFTLQAPTVQDRETALWEAKEQQAKEARRLNEEISDLKASLGLLPVELLINSLLCAAEEELTAKAAATLVEDTPDYAERLEEKISAIKQERRKELAAIDRNELLDRLVEQSVESRLHAIWLSAASNALLVRMLGDKDGKRLFNTVDEMKQSMPAAVMEKIQDTCVNFLSERGNAKVFLKPHTSSV